VYFKAHFGEEQKYSRYPIAAMIWTNYMPNMKQNKIYHKKRKLQIINLILHMSAIIL
jgi:hypothetical protein